jgi:Carboxypeptidase regulatory-like domain/TonB-dependent Receptor Plug Domain
VKLVKNEKLKVKNYSLFTIRFSLNQVRNRFNQPKNQLREGRELRRFMRFLRILFLFSFLTICVFAQNSGNISGLVLIDDHKPVANATVTLTDSKGKVLTVQTDANGKYTFENLPKGKYILVGNFDGGRLDRKEIEILQNQSVTADLNLVTATPTRVSSASTVRLNVQPIRETVNVSAGISQPLEDVSKTINVVDSKQLRERSEFSLGDTLRTIPGFRVQQAGGFGRLTTIKTRGLRNQDTAILLDGIRFRDAAAITGDASSFALRHKRGWRCS